MNPIKSFQISLNLNQLSRVAVASFAAVYLIWGSTFLAIRYAIDTIPPWGLSTMRFALAGLVLWGLSRFKREGRLTRAELRAAALSGPLLVVPNGTVGLVELWVPSGVVAVIVGAMPIWVMLLGWIAFGHGRPRARKVAGALLGLVGVGLIAGASASAAMSSRAAWASLLVVGTSWLWAYGTLLQRGLPAVRSPFRYTAAQVALGAIGTGLLSLGFEKPWAYDWGSVTAISWLAMLYLVCFGSVIAFSAYAWLSRNVDAHLVGTYALVNPVIAVLLGWAFLGEPVTPTFLAAAVIVFFGLMLLLRPERAISAARGAAGPADRPRSPPRGLRDLQDPGGTPSPRGTGS
jgi:drug/metabolite transporter (DMT)-like permease